MNDRSSPDPPLDSSASAPGRPDDLVKVIDRQGNTKMIPRAEFERKRRRRKRHEERKGLPLKEIVSIAFILAVVAVACYLALRLVK